MASTATALPLGEWTYPYEAFRSVNADNRVEAHPTSTPEPHQGVFVCKGCDIVREVTTVTKSNLSEELALMYPWMLTSTKTCILTDQEIRDPIYKHRTTIIGYMCRGCAFFHKRTGLNIRVVGEESEQLLKIERVFTTIQNQSVIKNVEEDDVQPLTYLDHLKDSSTYEQLFQLEENIFRVIEARGITTLPELVGYARRRSS